MSDLILSLPHYHRHNYSDLRSADNTHNLQFNVLCGSDKHLYLTSCLHVHNHNTCIRLPQTGCTVRKMALFIISKIAKHKYWPAMPWQPS